MFKNDNIGPEPESKSLVPRNARKRIQKVLSHMERSRRVSCSSSILASNQCSNVMEKDNMADIEDLIADNPFDMELMEQDKFILDPEEYVNTQKPLLHASTLPRHCYLSKRWYKHELNKVFLPSWTLIGREDEIPDVGMFLTLDLPWAGPVAVCRANDMKIYAFANTCKHRGAMVLQEKHGKASKLGLVCPYHAWTYDFDGTLKWAPGMNNANDFDEDDIALEPINIEVFHGFIFINALPKTSPQLKPFESWIGDLPRHMKPWYVIRDKI